MAKYYTIKLTEAQYNHVLYAMNSYEQDLFEEARMLEKEETSQTKLHERTEEALRKAQERK